MRTDLASHYGVTWTKKPPVPEPDFQKQKIAGRAHEVDLAHSRHCERRRARTDGTRASYAVCAILYVQCCGLSEMRRFEWDEEKNRANLAKHKISFETAQSVFDDPFALSIQDRFVDDEERWQTSGMIDDVLLIVVAHTWTDCEGDEVIRLISARKATRGERDAYAESQR